jgi:hypothetical protein
MDQLFDEVIRVYKYEPAPIQKDTAAGHRCHEGTAFRDNMQRLLKRPDVEVVTAVGKSTNGIRLDGNAIERVSYKMLRFKTRAVQGKTLVVAFNHAFASYDNTLIDELRAHAEYLNKLPGGRIVMLATPDEYLDYLTEPQ